MFMSSVLRESPPSRVHESKGRSVSASVIIREWVG